MTTTINSANLYLSDNQISTLQGVHGPPLSQFKLPSLDTLEIRGNQLKSLLGASHLHQVRTLYAGANQITDLSDLCFMSNLVRLHLRDNAIKKLDGFTNQLTSLQYLNLRQVLKLTGSRRLIMFFDVLLILYSIHFEAQSDDFLLIQNLKSFEIPNKRF